MRTFAFCFLLFLAAQAGATTVILTVTGRVLTTTSGDQFPTPPINVGDLWTATISYPYPTLAVPGDFIGIKNYEALTGRVVFSVNTLLWTSRYLGGFVSGTDVPPMEASLGGGGTGNGYALLEWYGGAGLVPDTTGLPDSFEKWKLPSANAFSLVVINSASFPGAGDGWSVTANAWDTLTIQIIPEPSAAALVLTIAVAALGRRGRVRA